MRRITEEDKETVDLLIFFAEKGELGLVVCREKATGEEKVLICGRSEENGQVILLPIALKIDGDVYQQFDPPDGAEAHAGGKVAD